MKTIIFLSDTHGNIGAISKLQSIMNESDFVVHAGDYYHDMRDWSEEYCQKLYAVKGNCDGGGKDLVFEVEGIKVLLTHGDRYGVKSSLLNLKLKAQELGAKLVLYGHTHLADISVFDGITFINPGAMTKYASNSYCYIVINKDKITAKIVEF